MKLNLVKTSLLALMAALFVGGLPVLTGLSSDGDSMSAQAQTRRTRRRPTTRRPVPTNTSVISVGTTLRVRLDTDLSSKEARVGDRFTATVLDPETYEGARVTGHISSIKKSGRVEGRTSMNLTFDSIETRNGSRGTMRAELVRVYDPDSESSKRVDEEGTVESSSRGKQTLKRSGIGAAAGAVLGAIVGGGKGAAIGLIVGGAAGAGSIAIEGSKELELPSGTELLIRVTSR
ncbi:MAG TPA: hypothetical protein VF131_25525 [Blastocatellia bacterium]|nr:hypothetical protein [Blastocatellia bacterium]